MTSPVNGLLFSTQIVVARFRTSQSRSKLSNEELVNYSSDEGDSHGARIQCFTEFANAKGKNNERLVNCMLSSHFDQQSNHHSDNLI